MTLNCSSAILFLLVAVVGIVMPAEDTKLPENHPKTTFKFLCTNMIEWEKANKTKTDTYHYIVNLCWEKVFQEHHFTDKALEGCKKETDIANMADLCKAATEDDAKMDKWVKCSDKLLKGIRYGSCYFSDAEQQFQICEEMAQRWVESEVDEAEYQAEKAKLAAEKAKIEEEKAKEKYEYAKLEGEKFKEESKKEESKKET